MFIYAREKFVLSDGYACRKVRRQCCNIQRLLSSTNVRELLRDNKDRTRCEDKLDDESYKSRRRYAIDECDCARDHCIGIHVRPSSLVFRV